MTIVLSELSDFMSHQQIDTSVARYSWLMSAFIEELFEEIDSKKPDEEKLRSWFEKFGAVIMWCGNGDDTILPDEIRSYLSMRKPELPALEAPQVNVGASV